MTVQVRLTRSPIRSRRGRRSGLLGHARTATPPEPAAHPPRADAAPEPIRHRHGGPSEDRALYNCGCGYVFEAAVSTSVGCPHCGGTQAW
jgi:hypothetical protein